MIKNDVPQIMAAAKSMGFASRFITVADMDIFLLSLGKTPSGMI